MDIGIVEKVNGEEASTWEKINLVGAWARGRSEIAEVSKTRAQNPDIVCWH